MAVLADVGALDVLSVLTGGVGTVVATDAVTGDAGMVETLRVPITGRMAVLTLVTAGDVVGMFTDGNRTIVTTETGPQDGAVIHPPDRYPVGGFMTILAAIGGWYVAG